MLESEDLWIVDTGATSHVTKHARGGIKQRKSAVQMKGCMEIMTANFEIDIPVMYCNKDGKKIRSAHLKEVQVNNWFNFNLFSATRMLGKGFKLKGDEKLISIYNKTCKFVFDTVIHTKHRALYCAIMKRKLANVLLETVNASVLEEKPMKKMLKASVKRVHKCLGHLGEIMTRAAAKHLKMTLLQGALPVCEICAIAKANQRNILKGISDESKVAEFNGWVYHDLAKIKVPEEFQGVTITKSNWHILVDKATKFKCSKFFEAKGRLNEDFPE
jgi:hypothetical protein